MSSEPKKLPRKSTTKTKAPIIPMKPHYQVTKYKEAEGKTVKALQFFEYGPEHGIEPNLQIQFTDGTSFDFHIITKPQLQADYMKDVNGTSETLREYGRRTKR
jgi:hypothetical protein